MKKHIYALGLGLLIVTACKSQQATDEATISEDAATEEIRKGPPQRGGSSLEDRLAKQEEMYTTLGLSEEQKVKCRVIVTKYAEKMRAARSGGRDAMKSTMDAKTNEIGEILTALQFAKYKELLAQRREQRKGPPRH
jgi:Spy/CpxP family protein refolding chaperone